MDPFTMAMIGSAIGGLTSKKPLKGALLGGMGGYAGATMLPGLLGTAPAAATAEAVAPTVAPGGLYELGNANLGNATGLGGTGTGLSVAPGQGLKLAETGAPTGLLDDLKSFGSAASDKLKAANETFKPVGQAMSSAQLVASMFPPSAPVETPAPQFGGGGNPVFNAMEQQQQAMDAQRMQEEMQRRQAQQKLLSMIGGR